MVAVVVVVVVEEEEKGKEGASGSLAQLAIQRVCVLSLPTSLHEILMHHCEKTANDDPPYSMFMTLLMFV